MRLTMVMTLEVLNALESEHRGKRAALGMRSPVMAPVLSRFLQAKPPYMPSQENPLWSMITLANSPYTRSRVMEPVIPHDKLQNPPKILAMENLAQPPAVDLTEKGLAIFLLSRLQLSRNLPVRLVLPVVLVSLQTGKRPHSELARSSRHPS